MNRNTTTSSEPPRRGFFRLVGGGVATFVLTKARLAHAKKLALPLAKIAKLAKVGGSTTLKIKGRPVLLIRDTEKSVRAFDPTCTHQKCKVRYEGKANRMRCECHKSAFDLDGQVLGGPAPKPLTRYPTKLDGGRLILDLPEKT